MYSEKLIELLKVIQKDNKDYINSKQHQQQYNLEHLLIELDNLYTLSFQRVYQISDLCSSIGNCFIHVSLILEFLEIDDLCSEYIKNHCAKNLPVNKSDFFQIVKAMKDMTQRTLDQIDSMFLTHDYLTSAELNIKENLLVKALCDYVLHSLTVLAQILEIDFEVCLMQNDIIYFE